MSAAGDTSVRRIEDYDLMDPATQQCPYQYYGLLREEAPVYRMPTTGFHLVTGFEVARKAVREPDLFESGVTPMELGSDGLPPEIVEIYTAGGNRFARLFIASTPGYVSGDPTIEDVAAHWQSRRSPNTG